MRYKCASCGTIVENPVDSSGTLQCPNCRGKIFFKVREPIARNVKAV